MRFGYRYTEDALFGRQMALRWRARIHFFPDWRPSACQRGIWVCHGLFDSVFWNGRSASAKWFIQRNVRWQIGLLPSDIPSRNITRTRSCWTRLKESIKFIPKRR